jgi:hypothetical protein
MASHGESIPRLRGSLTPVALRASRFPAGKPQAVLHCRRTGPCGLPRFPPSLEESMPRPPNYKQQKQRREDQQKKKNEEKQREIAERRKPPADPQQP